MKKKASRNETKAFTETIPTKDINTEQDKILERDDESENP